MLPEQFAYLIIVLTLIGYYFYFRDLIFGETKPNLVSWSLWALAPLIGTFFQLKAGAGFSALPIFFAGFGPMLVVIISLIRRNCYWRLTLFDIVCGIFSFIALIIYIITRNLEISILFAILSDGLAGFPTIVKSWKFPNTETGLLYFTAILSNVIGLLIVKEWTFTIYSFGIYFIVMNSIISFAIYHNKIFKKAIVS